MRLKRIFSTVLLNIALLSSAGELMVMDMVHHNPGEEMTESQFLEPEFLKAKGYGAKVFFLFEAAQFGYDWSDFDPSLFPTGTPEGDWVAAKRDVIHRKYREAKDAGLDVYCMLDMLVLPKALVDRHRDEITSADGKIDISKPFTRQCLRRLMAGMFDTFPELDGLVIRTGETYLHDAPYHVGNHPVQHGMSDHVTLLNLLRDEVCVSRGKKLIYRTWDMGRLHSLPKYYLEVSNSVEPHPLLWFSIKHTITDFWRSGLSDPAPDYDSLDVYWMDESARYGVPFNPCLGIGRHKQIVEVQCQREYEGKGAHPDYIASGVIDGFTEFRKPGVARPFCLSQLIDSGLFIGVWTWSRGGGWGGPYIPDEFWTELNASVLARWCADTTRRADDILREFALSKGLPEEETADFIRLCHLSEEGVIKGQYSTMGGVYVNWSRDDNVTGDNFLGPLFERIVTDMRLLDAYLAEKEEGAEIWREIERLSQRLHFASDELTHFVRTSCSYGRIKYELFAAAWQVMLNGYAAEKCGESSRNQAISDGIGRFDRLADEWKRLEADNADCPSLYSLESDFFGHPVGLLTTINRYRRR